MERRRYGRLLVPLQVEYQVHRPENGEVQRGQGVTRDISLGGAYLCCDSPCLLGPGQILDLTIATSIPSLDIPETSHLKAKGEVLRLDPPGPANPYWGVAVSFLDYLTFASL
jgi:hypothetical protein